MHKNTPSQQVIMKISKDSFFAVGSDLKIPKEQIEVFWSHLKKLDHEPAFFVRYLFYFGAMIVISAMTWFMNLGWEIFGGGGIFFIATVYACAFTLVSLSWDKKGLTLPAGLLMTMAVSMVPLAIYGLETYFNMWPSDQQSTYNDFYSRVEGKWIFMELGTILAGLIALRFFPFPFLTAPIFFVAWFLTMDSVPFIFGKGLDWEQKSWISLYFGLLLIAISFMIDHRKKSQYSFWGYFFGALSFWIGLNTLVWDKGEFVLFVYLIISLIMMGFSILVRRNVFMVFGVLGVVTYLSHLTYHIFKDSVLFPFVLSFIGLVMIYLGVLYQRNSRWIEKNVIERLPYRIRNLVDNQKDI